MVGAHGRGSGVGGGGQKNWGRAQCETRPCHQLEARFPFLRVILTGLLRMSLDSSGKIFETLSKGEWAPFQTVRPQEFVFFILAPAPINPGY